MSVRMPQTAYYSRTFYSSAVGSIMINNFYYLTNSTKHQFGRV